MRDTRNTVFADGPLGTDNYRQQLGQSVELGTGTRAGLRGVLVYTGATQHRNKMLPNGMSLRAAGDAAASLMQISCTYRPQNAEASARPLQIRGQIDWGTDGHQCTAYFDWLNGTVLQVAASSVRVIAEVVPNMGSTDLEPTFDAAAIATVGATIAYGGANRPPPTLTQQLRLPVTTLPTLPAANVAIPMFARRLWWLGPAPTSAQWAIGPGATQVIGEVDPGGLTPRQPYERPGPAQYIQVTGNGGPSTLNALVWELAL